eukprot:2963908-Pyramimonas_sp.AAC.1
MARKPGRTLESGAGAERPRRNPTLAGQVPELPAGSENSEDVCSRMSPSHPPPPQSSPVLPCLV